MSIAILIQSYGRFGGAERLAFSHFVHLQEKGCDVTLFYAGPMSKGWRERLQNEQVRAIPCGISRSLSDLRALLRFLRELREFDKIIIHHHVEPILARRFPVVQCDGKLLPFRDSMFSSIVCFSVLEHIKNHQTALSEMTRVLATGGICRVSQPVDNDPIFIIARRVVKNWQGDAILSHFSTSQLLGQIRTRMRVTNILYTSNAPISGVFSFFGRKTPRMLQT